MLTRRGRLVLRLFPALIGAGLLGAAIYFIAARLWYTGAGYCIGTLESCFQ